MGGLERLVFCGKISGRKTEMRLDRSIGGLIGWISRIYVRYMTTSAKGNNAVRYQQFALSRSGLPTPPSLWRAKARYPHLVASRTSEGVGSGPSPAMTREATAAVLPK
jgi:hypothetical protein